MAKEIERKFLVTNDRWKSLVQHKQTIRQAYLTISKRVTVRVRIIDDTDAMLAVKTALDGCVRNEFEYPIPICDAEEMLEHRVGQVIHKQRNFVPAQPYLWEIDVFKGLHTGLVMAEIELPAIDAAFSKPEWVGGEVTNDTRYYNSAIATQFSDWASSAVPLTAPTQR